MFGLTLALLSCVPEDTTKDKGGIAVTFEGGPASVLGHLTTDDGWELTFERILVVGDAFAADVEITNERSCYGRVDDERPFFDVRVGKGLLGLRRIDPGPCLLDLGFGTISTGDSRFDKTLAFGAGVSEADLPGMMLPSMSTIPAAFRSSPYANLRVIGSAVRGAETLRIDFALAAPGPYVGSRALPSASQPLEGGDSLAVAIPQGGHIEIRAQFIVEALLRTGGAGSPIRFDAWALADSAPRRGEPPSPDGVITLDDLAAYDPRPSSVPYDYPRFGFTASVDAGGIDVAAPKPSSSSSTPSSEGQGLAWSINLAAIVYYQSYGLWAVRP